MGAKELNITRLLFFLNMAKNKKKSLKAPKPKNLNKIDQEVEQTGRKDAGHLVLDICPRCGSSDIGKRNIDIPGYAPEVRVCNKCNFRISAPIEVPVVSVLEDDESDNEELLAKNKADFEKKLARAQNPEGQNEEEQEKPAKLPKQKTASKVDAKGKKGKKR